MLLKIGELAKRTGLTVRALHHYDAIGLLKPSARSDAGYRLYNRHDIERLHRIQALRRLDLSLGEIGSLLERNGADLQTVIAQQIAALDRQAARALELRDRLKDLLQHLNDKVEPDLPTWLATLELMAVHDRYFTTEELKTLRTQKERFRDDAASRWPALVNAIRASMERGIPPESESAQALSRQWMLLAKDKMDGDPRLMLKVHSMHRNEPAVQARSGVDGALLDYMARAFSVFRLSIYAKYLSPAEIDAVRGKTGRNIPQWLELIAQVRQQMEQHADPCSPEVQSLCARWAELFRAEWGDDPALHQKVIAADRQEPDLLLGTGLDQAMIAFLAHGIAHFMRQRPST
ncbi:MerR family transcriptional regulator [Noviherbaspirillum cavernae]|uniref:MerR family transcriptional regulator n=1 Tax=Noviherbaspirillum cavernae TaxID=2320862 RepID=A0A418X5E1_9BURK|nr:MerR family transcriptional regulator [Noviherbaspirillum cavernae]RJG07665.1 MerR family transcriptional regulator [Noviherbaspirillum cavernae]